MILIPPPLNAPLYIHNDMHPAWTTYFQAFAGMAGAVSYTHLGNGVFVEAGKMAFLQQTINHEATTVRIPSGERNVVYVSTMCFYSSTEGGQVNAAALTSNNTFEIPAAVHGDRYVTAILIREEVAL